MALSYPYASACAKLYVAYLYENSYLDDNLCITQNEAKAIFKTEFSPLYKIKFDFYNLRGHLQRLLAKSRDHNIYRFRAARVLAIVNDFQELENEVNKAKQVKKKTIVSQSFSFSNSAEIANKDSLHSFKQCPTCNSGFPDKESYNQHLNEARHRFYDNFIKASKQGKKAKQPFSLGFAINNSPNLHNITLKKNDSTNMILSVKNLSKNPQNITQIETNDSNEIQLVYKKLPIQLARSVKMDFVLIINLKESNEQVITFPILFTVQTNNNTEELPIELVFHIHDPIFDDLHAKEPFVKPSKPAVTDLIEEIDAGERPQLLSTAPSLPIPLKKYPLTADFISVLNRGLKPFPEMTTNQSALLNSLTKLLDVEDKRNCLNPKNYTEMLHTFVFLEEHQMGKDIRDYDRDDQKLKIVKMSNLLELEVPGLAENRPSVVLGDDINVKESRKSQVIYKGFVHRVLNSSVLLKFSNKFLTEVYAPDKNMFVSFSFNRYPYKVEHQAVDLVKAHNIASTFFSQPTTSQSTLTNNKITWFDPNIENNPQQQQAVQAILQKTSKPMPYLIFGPPGTGKTMVIVEAVKQIYKRTNLNILISAPSNSAANEIAKRLIKTIPKSDLFRYLAISYPLSQIPSEIKECINYKNKIFYQPSFEQLSKYRIVVTTLCTAAKLVNMGCPGGHFGYVFIDEAGQATESATLLPIAGILSSANDLSHITGQIVLAGDPKQIGPIIHSTLAKQYGFDISMLERLMEHVDCYKKDTNNRYNPIFITKLIKNYRSHPAIIAMPKMMFYDNELDCCGDDNINIALNWKELPNPKFPVTFHSVIGVDQREANSPSFFNVQEIEVVVSYLEKLIGTNLNGVTVTEEHIGVISPYKKQVEKISQVCYNKKRYSKDLLIGTVEQIQGQERSVIIVSTVRSRVNFLNFDSLFYLGFLKNPKRFNVAITRAKALLIVIGNPNLLQHDEYWRRFIAYCNENSAIAGEQFELIKESENLESSNNDKPDNDEN